MKRKLAKVFFTISALVLIAAAFTPWLFVIATERLDLERMFLELWFLIPIVLTAGVIAWLSYQYLELTEKTTL
tara:strand:- start:610 stop:828 length:219 start_codon:yes stop_codon:yes gene_type:complete